MDRPPPLRRRSLPALHTHAPPAQPQEAAAGRASAPALRSATGARGPIQAHTAPPEPASIRPCHARARQRLYRAIDHLTFRGALVPLVSSLLKLGTTAISGEGALRQALLATASGSALQSLLGAASAGDREHGFSWVSTLAPSPDLAPPLSVARWGLSASQADQQRLATMDRWIGAIDTGQVAAGALPAPGRAGLAQAQARLHAQLRTEKNLADALAGLVAMAVLLLDGMAASRAREDAQAGRLDTGPYLFVLVHMGLSLLLDAAACHWQMKMRSPSAAAYPRQATGALPPFTDVAAPLADSGAARPAGRNVAGARPIPEAAQASDSEVDVSEAEEADDSDLEVGFPIAPLPLRGWAPTGGPAAPAARPGGAPDPVAGRHRFDLR